MTRSEQIIEAVREEIIAAARDLVSPKEMTAWAGERGLLDVHVSAATGASLDGCRAKFRWHRSSNTAADITRMSIPLTSENFAGPAANWNDDRPTAYILSKMAEALDNQPDAVDRVIAFDTLYKKVFGEQREIDLAGFGFWLWKSIADGMSQAELEGHLRDSPEAQGK